VNLFNSCANIGLIQLTNTFNIDEHSIKEGPPKCKTYNVWLLLALQLSYVWETTYTK